MKFGVQNESSKRVGRHLQGSEKDTSVNKCLLREIIFLTLKWMVVNQSVVLNRKAKPTSVKNRILRTARCPKKSADRICVITTAC